MKKTLLTSLLILLGFVLSYGQTTPSGTGTQSDPYQISTLDNLVWLAKTDSVWDDGAYFVQTADIDASATDTMNIAGFNPGWSGIGSAATSFTGSYDGAGFVIDGLAVNSNKPNGGLFASVHALEVKDLGLTNIDMSVGGSSGALVGFAGDSSLTVTNCYATGEMVGNSNWMGGLIGFIKNTDYTITNSHTDVNVLNDGTSTGLFAAGFIGYIEIAQDHIGKIENCYSTGNVSLTDQAGSGYAAGFICGAYALGATTWNEISKCYSTGDVIGAIGADTYSPAGGFIGYLYWNFKVSECYATGNVTNKGKNGAGFIAYMKYASIVENCYSLGDVTRVEGSTQPNYGAFVGYQRENGGGASIIKSCYSIGKVSGIDGNNGFIGTVVGANSVDTLCYWDSDVSGQDSTAGSAVAKTTAEMQTEATFTDWDFASTWEIDGNYPNLKNNLNPELKPAALFAGSGTEADPYKIATLDDLVLLAKTDSYWTDSLYFVQTADIDASATDTLVIGGFNAGWSAIGNATTSFKGTYDGNGFVIDKLTTHGHNEGTALFGVVEGGITVKDLGLTDVRMTVGHFSGTLLGSAKGEIMLENCYATGTLEAQGIAGGLIGQIDFGSNMSITNCYTEVTVTNLGQGNYTMTGGFAGQILASSGTVSMCYSTGDVSSNPDADAKLFTGGFIGLFDNNTADTTTLITKCYSTGNVNGSPIVTIFSPAGGFAAAVYHSAVVSECYSTGNVVNAGKDCGGFVGYLKYSNAKVTNCFSLGNVTRNSGATQPNYGGFCGMTNSGGTISQSYSIGSVVFEGEDNPTGYGFVGNASGNDTLCYFDKETSMQDSTVGGAMGKTTAEMKTEATYVGWDFADVWMIEGDNYPTLKRAPVSVEDKLTSELPSSYALEQNYPNPFNPTTVISFALPQASDVQLSVYNILGQKVAELVNSKMGAGNHTVNFNAANLSTGVYIYRISANNFVSTKKMMLLK